MVAAPSTGLGRDASPLDFLVVIAIGIIGVTIAVRSGQSGARRITFVIAMGVAVVLAATLAVSVFYQQFFGKESTPSSPSSHSPSSPGPASGGAGTASPQQNRVSVDGQDQGVVEHVRCITFTDGINMKIAMGDHGVFVDLSYPADPPGVKKVQFSDINGGMTLEYESGKNQGNAEASKQGYSAGSWGNFYKITGTGSDPTQQVSKSFEIDVNCPT
jgi:hypothetical protein